MGDGEMRLWRVFVEFELPVWAASGEAAERIARRHAGEVLEAGLDSDWVRVTAAPITSSESLPTEWDGCLPWVDKVVDDKTCGELLRAAKETGG